MAKSRSPAKPRDNVVDGVNYNTFGFLSNLGCAEGIIRREVGRARKDMIIAWHILTDDPTPDDRDKALGLMQTAIKAIDALTGDETLF